MSKKAVWLMASLVAWALVGCGQVPATAPTYSAKSASAAKVSSKTAPKAPVASSRPATPQPSPSPSATPTPQPSEAAQAEAGSLKLALDVTGTATVSALSLKVFEQADPSVAVDVPLTLSNGKATWSQADVPPGRYTLQVKALGADQAELGQGTAEAVVTAGEASEVSLELRVNTVTITSDDQAPAGGSIGLTIEII